MATCNEVEYLYSLFDELLLPNNEAKSKYLIKKSHKAFNILSFYTTAIYNNLSKMRKFFGRGTWDLHVPQG